MSLRVLIGSCKGHSCIPALGLSLLGAAAVLGASPAQALTWYVSASFSGALAGTSTGIAVTDGTEAVIGRTYTIQSITGVLNALGQALPISGPTGFQSATNTFVYRGPGSAVEAASATGISWSVPFSGSTINTNLYNSTGPGLVNTWRTSNSLTGSVISSSIFAVPEPAPGPLPLLGAAAAFRCSRRLRRRQRLAPSAASVAAAGQPLL